MRKEWNINHELPFDTATAVAAVVDTDFSSFFFFTFAVTIYAETIWSLVYSLQSFSLLRFLVVVEFGVRMSAGDCIFGYLILLNVP